ncbi:polyphosphate polymerase domain-containing protein [Microbacterium koreense]|uniref:Polyphosphate polymerase domain-containing protein n=1 Tax=Microbacterium koreense TaxID=323761 RepID=A0ABW2ZQM9_9MICO
MNTLDRFAPISLDDLVADAALLTRIDRKYVIDRGDLDAILTSLDPATRVLEIDGARTFAYESVYFDTPDLLSFHLAARPRRRRFKLRTRTYLDVDAAYLELKTRGARGTTVKQRSEYDPRLRGELTADARGDAREALQVIGAGDRADDLTPALTTRYHRATLLASSGAARATVDTALEWRHPDGDGFALDGLAIVETKSGSAASDIDRLLWRAGHRPTRVSKYATGLAALRPDLPRNRWSRLLRERFAPLNPSSTLSDRLESSCAA